MNNDRPLTVLFLSTGNAARSILAEALLRHKGSHRFQARSAGYCPLPDVAPEALQILEQSYIRTSGLHVKKWTEYWIAAYQMTVDVIVTLSPEAQHYCPQWPNDPVRVHWPVDDPLGAPSADVREWKFRKCFATLESRVNRLVKTQITSSRTQLMLQLLDIGMAV